MKKSRRSNQKEYPGVGKLQFDECWIFKDQKGFQWHCLGWSWKSLRPYYRQSHNLKSSINFSIEYSKTSTLKLSPFVRTLTLFRSGNMIWNPPSTTTTSIAEIKRCLLEKWGIKRTSRLELLYDEFSMWILADLPWEITQKWENNKTNFCVIDFEEITEFGEDSIRPLLHHVNDMKKDGAERLGFLGLLVYPDG